MPYAPAITALFISRRNDYEENYLGPTDDGTDFEITAVRS